LASLLSLSLSLSLALLSDTGRARHKDARYGATIRFKDGKEVGRGAVAVWRQGGGILPAINTREVG